MTAINANDLAQLRSLASRGDKVANVLIRAFDALRAADKETHLARVATTANSDLDGLNTVDSVVTVAGDVVLVRAQTEPKDNGIYVVSAGAWTRLKDDQGLDVLRPGMLVSVREGTTLEDTLWSCTADAVVIGTDDITFAQLSESVAPASISATELAADSVTTVKILDANVTAGKLAAAVKAKIAGTSTIAVGAPVGDIITATITLKDLAGTALAAAGKATVWISDTAGGAPSAVPPDGGSAITTGVLLKEVTAELLIEAVSNASGVIAVALTESGTKNFYVNVAFGNTIVSSAVLAFS